MGVVLTAHDQETFYATTDSERVVLRLEKARRRFEGGEVSTRYRFLLIDHESLPADDDVDSEGQSTEA
jgi:hypothetical protein